MTCEFKITVTTMYCFQPLERADLARWADEIRLLAQNLDFRGLILISHEGVNLTVAGPTENVAKFKQSLLIILGISAATWKDSHCDFQPFKRFKVDIRPEIVTLKDPECNPLPAPGLPAAKNGHLTPEEWDKFITENPDCPVIDTRNHYEVQVGKFRSAIDPKTSHFSEFPKFLETLPVNRDKPILMYCTGGIRCEKAALAAQKIGFSKVFQLDGGILNYLARRPNSLFEGECFVFDNRVAVDQELAPSKRYKLCPHCGDPADHQITCSNCGKDCKICATCKDQPERKTCSKNCAHHAERAQQTSSSRAA